MQWNTQKFEKYSSKKIEKIIKSYLSHYSYGDRRRDYKKMLGKEKSLLNVQKITQSFSIKINKKDFIKAWKSHGTLRRNCENLTQFNKIISSITIYVNSLSNDYVEVPYDNVAYLAQLK